jgi:hypothetical protein
MTTPSNPEFISPQEPRPTLPKKHSSGSLPDTKPASTLQSPTVDGRLSVSTPDVPPTPTKSLPHRIRSTESPTLRSVERSSSSGTRSTSPATSVGHPNEPKQIVVRSFAPRVAVYASTDTEDLIREKGFSEGLRGLLRPYGDNIPGKVTVRDSVGSSKTWEDFGVRIVSPEDAQPYRTSLSKPREEPGNVAQTNGIRRTSGPRESSYSGGGGGNTLEKLVDQHLRQEEAQNQDESNGYVDHDHRPRKRPGASSAVYPLYLRKLFSSMLMVPYETFCHPVSCIIAVSSRNPSSIDTLRQLYTQSARRIPAFVGAEYLRYYVLIHDEDRDDITKSTALFDLMKRHFGLHCHLLRLRSSHCVQSDDDSTPVPPCSWLPPEDDLGHTNIIDYTDDSSTDKYIFDSDAASIRSFLREMITQSIVPFMENRIMTWNDQVASRRRGLSGRFISLSKRWTGFGSSSRSSQSSSATTSNTNYDAQQGFYPPETPEATMRTLADYAFMLRDFRLAYSTYDFLRSDFAHDKAWAYHAAANEMAALAYLLIPQPLASSKSRSETVDNMLDTATYSYLTRCSLPFGVIRTLTTATELLISRGPASAQDAARWGGKLLELGVLVPVAQAFMAERMAVCYRSRTGTGILAFGSRRRQTALWSLMAAQSWARIERPVQARRQLESARALYGQGSTQGSNFVPFKSMHGFWITLEGLIHGDSGEERDSVTVVEDRSTFASRNTSVTHIESEQMNEVSVPPLASSPRFSRRNADPLGVRSLEAGSGESDWFE